MSFLKTIFSKAFTAFGERPGIDIAEPATTSNSTGSPVCLTDTSDDDDNPRTMHSSDLIAVDNFREESIPWQLC